MRPTMSHYVIECRIAIQAKDTYTYVREFLIISKILKYILNNSSIIT